MVGAAACLALTATVDVEVARTDSDVSVSVWGDCGVGSSGVIAACGTVVVVDVVVVVVDVVVVVVVVVGITFNNAIAVAVVALVWSPLPNWPKSFFPQHRTSPVAITAHEWLLPVVMSTTVPSRPVTVPGVTRFVEIAPEPN